jgi:hypothetical protein
MEPTCIGDSIGVEYPVAPYPMCIPKNAAGIALALFTVIETVVVAVCPPESETVIPKP